MLIIHIIFALSSVFYTSYLYFKPRADLFRPAYLIIGGTLGSGTVLVVSSGSPLRGACVSGLAYLSAVSIGLVLASRKLRLQNR